MAAALGLGRSDPGKGRRHGGGGAGGGGGGGPLISEIVPATTTAAAAAAASKTDSEGARAIESIVTSGASGRKEAKRGAGVSGRKGEEAKRDTRGQPVVKKGFLSKLGGEGRGGVSALYPPGGSENGAEASSYVKLMSRCKVVDTANLSKEEVRCVVRCLSAFTFDAWFWCGRGFPGI